MKKVDIKNFSKGALALLVAWQATDFALDYKAILSAVIVAGLAGTNTKKKTL